MENSQITEVKLCFKQIAPFEIEAFFGDDQKASLGGTKSEKLFDEGEEKWQCVKITKIFWDGLKDNEVIKFKKEKGKNKEEEEKNEEEKEEEEEKKGEEKKDESKKEEKKKDESKKDEKKDRSNKVEEKKEEEDQEALGSATVGVLSCGAKAEVITPALQFTDKRENYYQTISNAVYYKEKGNDRENYFRFWL
ncbi:hypothetical protein niasHS_016326 [Heterodera schachtii]|uniref:Uncharacterized protein n=1 Tax=Heterodera schachtii TaxID=97005 RepID=A0ABD2I2N1_HETSC